MLFEGKARNDVVGLTGFCFIDIDHIETCQMSTALDLLQQDRHVVIATTSISGKGLHIVVKYGIKGKQPLPQRVNMTPAKMQKMYKRVFDCIAKEYETKLGIKSDHQAGHMERLLILSYNPNIYYNADAEPILIDTKSQPATICTE